MLGLDSSLGKDIVGIINNVFQAPWGGSHTCQKDEKALECSLCQSSILCYQLGCELLERLTPREEIRLVVRREPRVCACTEYRWSREVLDSVMCSVGANRKLGGNADRAPAGLLAGRGEWRRGRRQPKWRDH